MSENPNLEKILAQTIKGHEIAIHLSRKLLKSRSGSMPEAEEVSTFAIQLWSILLHDMHFAENASAKDIESRLSRVSVALGILERATSE